MSRTIVLGIANRLGGDDAAGTCLMDMLNPALSGLSAGQRKPRISTLEGLLS